MPPDMQRLPDLSPLGPRPAVVLHDAGAANLVVGWLAGRALPAIRPHLAGPAAALWADAFPDIPGLPLSDALNGCTGLVSGTGWGSALEHSARMAARDLGIPIVAAVDHWVNYRQRFVRDDGACLPDEIWVGDAHALAEARRQIPEVRAVQFANIYLEKQVAAVHAAEDRMIRSAGAPPHVLYALEPIRLSWQSADLRPGEFQALDYFVSRMRDLGFGPDTILELRPHPSDPAGKYDAWIAGTPANARLVADDAIADAVARADAVAGCETFVLIIAMESGRRAISTLPPWGNPLRLPHPEIEQLRYTGVRAA